MLRSLAHGPNVIVNIVETWCRLKHGLGICENTAEAWLEVFGGMVLISCDIVVEMVTLF